MDKKIGFPKFNLKNSRKSYVTNYFMKCKVISVDSKENFKITTFYKLTDTEKEIVENDIDNVNNEGEPNKDDLNKDNKKNALPNNIIY